MKFPARITTFAITVVALSAVVMPASAHASRVTFGDLVVSSATGDPSASAIKTGYDLKAAKKV